MQTSKEELQSSNEELHTINAELQSRNTELALVNDDLMNLLASMNMPIVMTGRDLRIRRFTPIAEKAFMGSQYSATEIVSQCSKAALVFHPLYAGGNIGRRIHRKPEFRHPVQFHSGGRYFDGFVAFLGFPTAAVPAVSGTDQGQGGGRRFVFD